MTPNEKAIQSRIKEVFSYKVTNHLWELIMESLKQVSITLSAHSGSQGESLSESNTCKSDSEVRNKIISSSQDFGAKTNLPFDQNEFRAARNKAGLRNANSGKFSHPYKTFMKTKTGKKLYYPKDGLPTEDFKFELEEDLSSVDCNTSNSSTVNYIIYPAGDTWVGIDQSTASVDETLYETFINFLKEYFTEDLNDFWNKYDTTTTEYGADNSNDLVSTCSRVMATILDRLQQKIETTQIL